MRRRGYDVQARSTDRGLTQKGLKEYYEGLDVKSPSKVERLPKESRKSYVNRSYDNFCNELERQGDGARGYVMMNFEKLNGSRSFSGHAMFYEVKDGSVKFYDGQSNKSGKELDGIFSLADPSSYSYARVDNLKITEQITKAIVSKKR